MTDQDAKARAFFGHGIVKPAEEPYVEDPDEITPCIACGEPGPNREACWCLAPFKEITVTFEVVANTDKDFPSVNALIAALEDGLPDEWTGPLLEGEWRLRYIGQGGKA
ncbi:MAG: hypothetical protein ABIJ75_07225 [Actinomycetota bacterium]